MRERADDHREDRAERCRRDDGDTDRRERRAARRRAERDDTADTVTKPRAAMHRADHAVSHEREYEESEDAAPHVIRAGG